MPGGPVWDRPSTPVIAWVPLKPCLDVSLLIFAPGRTPFGRAENPPIAFICELKKKVRRGLVLLGKGQSAISDRAGVAHGIPNPNATKHGFKYRKKILVPRRPTGSGQRWRTGPVRFEGSAAPITARNCRTHQRAS
jgi:hypothetical protein